MSASSAEPSPKKVISACFHTFCAAALPILLLYTGNIEQLSLSDAIILMTATGLFSLVTLFIASHLFSSLYKASLTVSLAFFLFMSHGHFNKFLILTKISKIIGVLGEVLLLLAFFTAALLYIHVRVKDYDQLALFVNVMAIAMILMSIGNITSFHINRVCHHDEQIEAIKNTCICPGVIGELPDIFYIIIDGYARNDTLSRLYNYDNNLPYAMESHGFYIASESYSNYIQTNLSVSSSLNSSYLDTLAAQVLPDNSLVHTRSLLSHNAVSEVLKRANYKTVAFESGYDITEIRNADKYYSDSFVSRQFLDMVLTRTSLVRTKQPFIDLPTAQARSHARFINRLFAKLGCLKDDSSPQFVFAHISCPHPPFVFFKDGSVRKPIGDFDLSDGNHLDVTPEDYRQLYREQIEYVNQRLSTLIIQLLKPSARKKVIILQSDHGPGSSFDWENIQNTDLAERFGILNAIYFPDQDYSELYPSISPVNTFRVVFNKYLGASLDLIEDRHYYSTWDKRYEFVDVTKELRNEAKASVSVVGD